MEDLEPTANNCFNSDSNILKNKNIEEDVCSSEEEFYESKESENLNDNNEQHDQEAQVDEEDEDEFFDITPLEFSQVLLEQNQSRIENNFIDRIIEQRRNEIALELRRLHFQNQTQSRNRLENFFLNSINQNSSNEPNRTNSASSNIQNEISQLSSIRRVTSVLSTSRSQIETALQNMLGRNPRTNNNNNNMLLNIETRQAQTAQIQTQNEIANINNNIRRVQSNIRNNIEQISREQVIEEISELVHRQLVSNSLQSEFRSVLERRVMDRLNRIGTDGIQTRQFIRNLPTNPNIQRNDFSHLGLNLTNSNSNQDNISDSASSINEPRAIRVINNNREIKELKNEINELKNMLKLSFELQLDMQRSLKQEINALINGTFNNKENNISNRLLNSTRPVSVGKCLICTESDSDTVFYQCGHICACYTCSMNLKQKGHNCPVCRAPIKDIIRSYKCALD